MATDRATGGHAPTGATGPRHDGRSVGELLHDADHLARTLLMDLTAQDAPAVLRSWPRLVDAAAAAWTAINRLGTDPAAPHRTATDNQAPPGHDAMLRLHAITEGIADTLASARWPGTGPGAAAFEEIAHGLDQVTHVLNRVDNLPLHRLDVQGDVSAAQMRLMHTVYLSAHAITSALQQYGRQLYRDGGPHRRTAQLASPGPPYAVGPTGRWVQRIAVCEGIAGHYVRGTGGGFATAVTGEVVPRFVEPGRLRHELARWDIQVHRSLATDPSPPNLVLISRTQAMIAAVALPVLTTAHRARLVAIEDVGPVTDVVEISGNAWSQLASRWGDLAPTDSRPDSELTRAVAHLRAATQELGHAYSCKSSESDNLQRVDIARTLNSIQHALAAAVDVAHLTCDPASDPNLTGLARPLSIRAHNDTEREAEDRLQGGLARDVVWVTPSDILKDRIVPLPRPVFEGLRRGSTRVVRTTQRAAAAACAGSARYVSSGRAVPPDRPRPPIPHGHDRAQSPRGPSR